MEPIPPVNDLLEELRGTIIPVFKQAMFLNNLTGPEVFQAMGRFDCGLLTLRPHELSIVSQWEELREFRDIVFLLAKIAAKSSFSFDGPGGPYSAIEQFALDMVSIFGWEGVVRKFGAPLTIYRSPIAHRQPYLEAIGPNQIVTVFSSPQMALSLAGELSVFKSQGLVYPQLVQSTISVVPSLARRTQMAAFELLKNQIRQDLCPTLLNFLTQSQIRGREGLTLLEICFDVIPLTTGLEISRFLGGFGGIAGQESLAVTITKDDLYRSDLHWISGFPDYNGRGVNCQLATLLTKEFVSHFPPRSPWKILRSVTEFQTRRDFEAEMMALGRGIGLVVRYCPHSPRIIILDPALLILIRMIPPPAAKPTYSRFIPGGTPLTDE